MIETEFLDIPRFLRSPDNQTLEEKTKQAIEDNQSTGAIFSSNRRYRYALWRRWEKNAPYALFIGLNPSTADEFEDDPTIRRCRRFASDWGFGALCMVNLFAIRSRDPKDMMRFDRPIGVENDAFLRAMACGAGVIVCAWGANGGHRDRDKKVLSLLKRYEMKCLGTTKEGQPKHPLYIKADQPLEAYQLKNEVY